MWLERKPILIKWCKNNTKQDAFFCKRIPYNTVYNVWRDMEPTGSLRQIGAQSLPKVGDMSVFRNSVIFYGTMKLFYTGFSCKPYQLHFPQPHIVPQTSLSCKGSTSFGPFAMLCCLTSLCLQNDTWPGQDGHALGKGGWLLYEALPGILSGSTYGFRCNSWRISFHYSYLRSFFFWYPLCWCLFWIRPCAGSCGSVLRNS